MAKPDATTAPVLPHGKLLEGIVTTLNADSTPNIAPMGPIVDANFERLLLRPFRTSLTYRNLKQSGEGILHVTDDVELFAHAAVGKLDPLPRLEQATAVRGVILSDACRWYAFQVESIDDRQERTTIVASVVDHGRLRDFFGFNRAKHAVIEAAILATRIGILESDTISTELVRLEAPVEKTGGEQERRAFQFLQQYVHDQLQRAPEMGSGQQ